MLALLIPQEGTPFFEHVPDDKRGKDVSIIVQERKLRGGVDGYVQHRYVRIDFRWVTTFLRKNHDVAFDVFEEIS